MAEAEQVEKPRILLVDDERTARLSLAEILRMEGYDVVVADGGKAAVLFLRARDFDVVLCDLKMPEVDGLDVLAVCRQHRPATEFILLTAYGTMDTAVEALRRGASDYLLKPALPETILQSVRKMLERRRQSRARQSLMGKLTDTVAALQQVAASPEPAEARRVVQGGGIMLDHDRRLAIQDGEPLALTPTEFDILSYLIKADSRPVSAEELVAHVHGYYCEPDEARSLVRVHISRLRQKVEQNPAEPRQILTVRGVGYAFGGGGDET
jgi:two-component system KDP operon response regulator KdpE